MGNLRQSMTNEEWAELQPSYKGTLIEIIPPVDGEPNILNDIVDRVNHPKHYGGKDNQYEAIKVIDAWDLDFALGNVVKYVSRAGKKNDSPLEDLKKAAWYLNHKIESLSK
jgi:hypothetical protein